MHSYRSRRSREAGFTLVEILVVLAIIGLIMSLVGPRVLNSLSEAKTKSARIQIDAFASALDLFFLDTGRYPTTAEGLNALVTHPENTPSWNGPYLRTATVPLDPWGTPYVLRVPGQQRPYDLMSLGSDKREGGTGSAADITNGSR